MDDEAFKLPETSPLDPSDLKGNVQPYSKLVSNSLFGRFVQKVNGIFNRSESVSDLKLSGRIRELKTVADTTLLELLEFKKNLQKIIDPDLFSIIFPLLDPLIKEISKTFPVIEKKDSTAHQVKMFSRYSNSIEKANAWVEIGKLSQNNKQLEEMLIEQIIKDFLLRIDRDIQLITDYLSQAFTALEISDVFKEEVKDQLMPNLSPKISNLYQLKKKPDDLSLKSFMSWRAYSDKSREILFGEALHIIDHHLPTPILQKESEHFQAIIQQLNRIEERMNAFALSLNPTHAINESQQKQLSIELDRLEREVHQLNVNLHLSHEHSEKIESFLETLLSLRKTLS